MSLDCDGGTNILRIYLDSDSSFGHILAWPEVDIFIVKVQFVSVAGASFITAHYCAAHNLFTI